MAETDNAASTGFTPHSPSEGGNPQPAGGDDRSSGAINSPASATDKPASKVADAKQAIGSNVASLQQQAADKVRLLAEDGKARAGGALDQFSQMLLDAAGQVDDKLGAQYGDHARTAATTVQKFADSVRDKDVDELADDVRGYIRKSPAAAVGVTVALGFALARMVHAGLDQRA